MKDFLFSVFLPTFVIGHAVERFPCGPFALNFHENLFHDNLLHDNLFHENFFRDNLFHINLFHDNLFQYNLFYDNLFHYLVQIFLTQIKIGFSFRNRLEIGFVPKTFRIFY